MNKVDEMPTTGQFVAMWVYNGEIWSSTHRWVGGVLEGHNAGRDSFDPDFNSLTFDPKDEIEPTFWVLNDE